MTTGPFNEVSGRRLLLVGGGHAHLEVVRLLAGQRNVSATLLNPERFASYSGMLPGLVAGNYSFDQAHVDLEALCRRSGVQFVRSAAVSIDPKLREVRDAASATHPYDVLSVDAGSTPDLAGLPGAREFAVPVKPVASFLGRWDALVAARSAPTLQAVVIGGGAGGVELAMAMQHRFANAAGSGVMAHRLVLLATSLLPGHSRRAQRLIGRALYNQGIAVVRERAVRVTGARVETAGGGSIPADFVVCATKATAPAWLRGSGLATDSSGFIAVNASLQSVSHPEVFAAGDIASLGSDPMPKSGVYAVRSGPVLFENLRAALAGSLRLRTFEPQRRALSLLATGEKSAVLSYGRLALEGRWLWQWKDRIDRRFVGRYTKNSVTPSSQEESAR